MKLLTWHGTIVGLRADGRGLVQLAPDATDPGAAPLDLPFGEVPAEGLVAVRCSLGVLAVQRSPGGRGITLSRYGRLLCADENGIDLTFSRDEVGLWENFLPITTHDLADLRHLTTHRWIHRATRRVIPRAACTLLPEFRLNVGGAVVDLAESLPLAAHPRAGEPYAPPDAMKLQAIDTDKVLDLTLAAPRSSALIDTAIWPPRMRRNAEMMTLAAHRVMLGREPEQAELERDVRFLIDRAGAAGLADLMELVAARGRDRWAPGGGGQGPAVTLGSTPALAPQTLGAAPTIALGTYCVTATVLHSIGLSPLPMPFDWLGLTPALVRHCLETDFSVLLDRSHYVSLTGKPELGEPVRGCSHEFYRAKFGVRRVFNHADPTEEADYRYLLACVDRFRAVMAEPGPKLFVQVNREQRHTTQADFEATADLLDRLTTGAVLLSVTLEAPDRRRAVPLLHQAVQHGVHTQLRMHPISVAAGMDFDNERDRTFLGAVVQAYATRPPTSPAVARAERRKIADAVQQFHNQGAAAGYDTQSNLTDLDAANRSLRGFQQSVGLPTTTQFGFYDRRKLTQKVPDQVMLVEVSAERATLRIDPARRDVWSALTRALGLILILDEMQAVAPVGSAQFFAEFSDEGVRDDSVSFCSRQPGACLIPDSDFIATGGHDALRQEIASQERRWEDRRPVVFWRGATTGRPRRPPPELGEADDFTWLPRLDMVARARRSPHAVLYDVGISDFAQLAAGPVAQARAQAAGLVSPRVGREAFLECRAVLVIDGNTNAWSALFCGLLSGSCVLKVESEHGFRQWYYDQLKPWIHYVPVSADLSDMDDVVAWVMSHDDDARAIGAAGQAFAEAMTFERAVREAGERLRGWIAR
jgi:hypothetical protein